MQNGHVAVYDQQAINDQDGEVRVSSEGSLENKVVRMFRMEVGGYYDSEEPIA